MITQEMIDFCVDLGTGKERPVMRRAGLCSNFRREFHEDLYSLINFSNYPKFSGYEHYPIHKPWSRNTSEEDYDELLFSGNMWEGHYGKARKDFCLWAGKELTRLKELENNV